MATSDSQNSDGSQKRKYPSAAAVTYMGIDGNRRNGLAEAIEKERLDREAKARRAKLEKATPTFKLEAPVGPDRKPRSKS